METADGRNCRSRKKKNFLRIINKINAVINNKIDPNCFFYHDTMKTYSDFIAL